jgi:DNA-binding transcriptional ArsR family regulator
VNHRRAAAGGETTPADAEAVFAALAHASRRQILLVLLFRGGEVTAGDIAGRFACAWPTTTRHLRVLENAGLVRAEKRGRERVYRLDRARLLRVAGGWLRWFQPAAGGKAAGPGLTGRRASTAGRWRSRKRS